MRTSDALRDCSEFVKVRVAAHQDLRLLHSEVNYAHILWCIYLVTYDLAVVCTERTRKCEMYSHMFTKGALSCTHIPSEKSNIVRRTTGQSVSRQTPLPINCV